MLAILLVSKHHLPSDNKDLNLEIWIFLNKARCILDPIIYAITFQFSNMIKF